ncbi:DNA adenine methylase [uncultured Adlercreutzia sp.]|uniref:DNA adenine methylase n=1 Tax=uncultured Adlercreutzia sp. TaxID=875803 RepID=UPI0026F3F85C|nr:DNA adenine methylase [uncultured Adlercreutzia sp.]
MAALDVPQQLAAFPNTRFMGSKYKLIPSIYQVVNQLQFSTVLDLFSGTAVVSYLFKSMGKSVVSNDYMAMAYTFARALIENSSVRLEGEDVHYLLNAPVESDGFVRRTFEGLYYSAEDNDFIDEVRARIAAMEDVGKHSLAQAALIRACMKKRPRGIFTYTGFRYDDGRRDLRLSLREQFVEAVGAFNHAVFDSGSPCSARQGDALAPIEGDFDLVYLDPPYFSPLSDNEYVRRYHFVEGIARDWRGVAIQQNTKTKKFKSYPTPFSRRDDASEAFEELFDRYRRSTLLVSYSSNSLPGREEMISFLRNAGKEVEVVPVDYRYSFGNQANSKTRRNQVKEYLFVGL